MTATGTRRLIGVTVGVVAGWPVGWLCRRRLGFHLGELVIFGPAIAMFVFGCYALKPREHPAAFQVREGEAFVAPPSAAFGYFVVSQMFMLVFVGGRATEERYLVWLQTATVV